MSQKLCLITGVGEDTGVSIARRFANSGYQLVEFYSTVKTEFGNPNVIVHNAVRATVEGFF